VDRRADNLEEASGLIDLRAGPIKRDELEAEILRRVWWDRFGYFVLLAVSMIAMVAAVEGWPRAPQTAPPHDTVK